MPASVAKAPTRSAVIKVGGREHFGGHGFHHHHGHGGFGVGLGIGIIGGLLAAEAYNAPGYAPGYGYDEDVYDGPAPEDSGDPRELCAEKFRSFDWKTGLYTTHSGEKKLCPYLK
ncbi:MAG: BA14K family protein [Hyphomicrobiaceae bacterium]|nr:BA14K family protein [Hyphomicrobiaceae bacterium]